MSPQCDCCRENVNKLNQQVSVMRKEIKNLRQMLDSGVRAHRKHMTSIQSVLSKNELSEPGKGHTLPIPSPPPTLTSPQAALEQGNIQTVPIGYISSCFSVKNGTPRQPTICGPSRAELRIQQSVFNNPEHTLVGLEHYSHVWVIFVFHKNGHLSYKAKVKPPRLNGQRVGVYSTQSPHRPNALGLTLAKLDKIIGDTLYLSDIDMIAGTPVLDIKPFIPEYDSPFTRMDGDSESKESNTDERKASTVLGHDEINMLNLCKDSESDGECSSEGGRPDVPDLKTQSEPGASFVKDQLSFQTHLHTVLEEVKAYVTQGDCCQPTCESKNQLSDLPVTNPAGSVVERPCYGQEVYSTIAQWIREPPVSSLEVRFTPQAERELREFLPSTAGPPETEGNKPRFKFLHSSEEAAAAIRGVLSADPRSVYRRTRCSDRLFFFTLDTADVTCWFGHGFVEVLQIRPVQ